MGELSQQIGKSGATEDSTTLSRSSLEPKNMPIVGKTRPVTFFWIASPSLKNENRAEVH
jgi:hypothetical protein